jgi:hypothetical protein
VLLVSKEPHLTAASDGTFNCARIESAMLYNAVSSGEAWWGVRSTRCTSTPGEDEGAEVRCDVPGGENTYKV